MPFRSFSEVEVVLKARRRVEVPLLLVIWLSIAMFSVAEGNYSFLAAGTLTVGMNLFATLRGKELYMNRLFIYVLVSAGLVLLFVETFNDETVATFLNGGLSLEGITHFIIIILLAKLCQRKRNRDYVQMLALSFAAAMAGSLICEQLWYAVLLLVYLVIACHVMMALMLKRGLDASARTQLPGESEPPPAAQVAWNAIRDWPGRTIRRLLAPILVAMLLTGVALFILAPRLGQAINPLAIGSANALSGLAQRVRLGDARQLYLSERVVMRVRLLDADGATLRTAPPYLLAATASLYEDSTWRMETQRPAIKNLIEPDATLRRGAVVQEVSMRASVLPRLPTAYPVLRIDSASGYGHIHPDGTGELLDRLRSGEHVRYRAWSWLGPLSQEQRAFLQRRRGVRPFLPQTPEAAISPRVRELARQWCEDLIARRAELPSRRDELDLAIARRLSRRLSEDYTYTLDLRAADASRDGVEDFLFYMKEGHCEYFASALTVMCQALGVRARLATGYRSDEIDPDTDELIVRDRDAHAWCEVFTPSTDFTVVDPSPAPSRLRGEVGWWGRLRLAWNDAQFVWQERILGYDAERRQKLAAFIRGQLRAVGLWFRVAGIRLAASLHDLVIYGHIDSLLVRVSRVVTGATLFVALLALWRGIRRRLKLRRAYAAGEAVPPAQMAFMRRLLKLLAARGIKRTAAQTPREALAVARDRFNLPPETTDRLVRFYDRLRWGKQPASQEELRNAERLVADLAASLKS